MSKRSIRKRRHIPMHERPTTTMTAFMQARYPWEPIVLTQAERDYMAGRPNGTAGLTMPPLSGSPAG